MPGSFCLITNVLQQTDGHNCTVQTYTLKYAVKLKGVAKQLLNNKRDAFASLIQLYDHTIKFKYEMYYKSQLHLFNTKKKYHNSYCPKCRRSLWNLVFCIVTHESQ